MARGLTREALVKAALDIVDRDGLDGLSMRKLGAELSVDPMAAYRHLPNKKALLDGVVEAVVREVDLDVDASLPWQDQLRQLAHANLAALLAHPNAVPLLATRPLSTPDSLRLPEKAFGIMTAVGIPLYDAGLAINTLGLLATSIALAYGTQPTEEEQSAAGAALAALPPDEFPHVYEGFATGQLAHGFEEVLDFAMDAVIARLEAVRSA